MAKVRVKKQSRGKAPKGVFLSWVVIALFIAALVSIFAINSQQVMTSPIPEGARAAIVDQLYTNYANEDFSTKVTKKLEDYGFEVDIYQSDAITVDLYRNLPTYGYKLVVFRVHSGPVGTNPQALESGIGTYLFTNEPYTEINHLKEQLNDEVSRAKVAEGYPYVFAVDPKFIINSMKGNFDDTVVIIGGCSALYNDDLAQAFIDKGASVYLAWDATVSLDYVDEATVSLIKNLCSERFTVKKGVDLTMVIKGPDPKYQAVLKYYPRGSGSKTIAELIGKR